MYTRISILLLLIISAVTISAAEGDTFYFKVSVAIDGQTGASRGSGGFVVGEDRYGRIGILFGNDLTNFEIRSVGGAQFPITRSSGAGSSSELSDNTRLALDIYLKGRVTKNRNILADGVIIQSTRVPQSSPPAFTYSEDKVKFELSSGEDKELTIDPGVPDVSVKLTIRVEASDPVTYVPRTERYVAFASDYSLLNEDTKQYETKDCRCTLGMGIDERNGQGECHYRKVYHLPEGETLLYLSTFSIDNISWKDNNSISFDFTANHIYAFNPEDTLAEVDGLEAEQMTVTVFNKAITARNRDTVEIEIPIESHSPLPFRATETIVLSTSVISSSN